MIPVALLTDYHGKPSELVTVVDVPESKLPAGGPEPSYVIWDRRLFVGPVPYGNDPRIKYAFLERIFVYFVPDAIPIGSI
jgi:hypothetical protein